MIVLGHSGSISLEAMRWLKDVGAGFIQLDPGGEVIAAWSAASYDQPRLRRAQAKAFGTPDGLAISKGLIEQKLVGQLATLEHIADIRPVGDGTLAAISDARSRVREVGDEDELRAVEADGAAAYWSGWREIGVKFVGRHAELVPTHWCTFGTRSSGLKGGPRAATNPLNALLNYVYALLEAEAVIAIQTVGLLPDVGIFHMDQRFRNSLAADVMEPVRPEVDRYVFDLVRGRSFAAADWFETRTGICRITTPLAAELAGTRSHWATLVGQVAEQVAHALVNPPSYEPMARLFTRPSERRRGRPGKPARPDKRTDLPNVNRRCANCGKSLTAKDDRTCNAECLNAIFGRSGHKLAASMQMSLKAMREAGDNPQARPEAKKRMAAGLARRQGERAAWEAANPGPYDNDGFQRDVMPKLGRLSVGEIMRATGLSTASAWRIRKGTVPHAMWWGALRDLCD